MAKRCATEIQYSRGKDQRRRLYRKLIAAVHATRAALQRAAGRLAELAGVTAERWHAQVSHYFPLIARVLDQSERRVLHGQVVPATDKLVSLLEPHADIIVKGARDVQYGHKLNLVTGKSGLILDVVIEAGNPADAERFLPMLDRHIARCGAPPRQMAADGGYASRDNLTEAKGRGVTDVAFHKKRGLAVADMTKSPWVYRKLRNFRAGIEAGISCFKRAYGGDRCTWRGLDHFKAYVWSAVVAHNLVLFARLKPAEPAIRAAPTKQHDRAHGHPENLPLQPKGVEINHVNRAYPAPNGVPRSPPTTRSRQPMRAPPGRRKYRRLSGCRQRVERIKNQKHTEAAAERLFFQHVDKVKAKPDADRRIKRHDREMAPSDPAPMAAYLVYRGD